MRFCVRAALVASCLLFVPGLLEQFEAPKAAAIRILGLGALAVWLLRPEARRRFRLASLDGAVLLWLGVEAITTVASSSPRVSLLGDTKQSEGLVTSLGLAGLYLAARAASRSTVRGTLHVTLAAIALASLYAALQALRLDPTRWGQVATYESAGAFVRPFGTLGHPNVLGVITAAGIAMALALAFGERGRAWVWGGLAALLAAVTLATLSRGAWLGAMAGMLVVAALATLTSREIGSRRVVLPIAAGALVLAIVLGFSGVGPMLGQRFAEMLHPETGSARSRLEIWKIAWHAWQARPWVGLGPDTFELMFPRFQTPEYWRFEWGTVPAHAHSIYLHLLATRGALGALSALALAAGWVAAAVAAWRAAPGDRVVIAAIGATVAMIVAGGFGALGLSGATLLAALAASLLALSESPERSPEPALARGKARASQKRKEPTRGRRWTTASGVGALTAAVVAVFSGVQLMASRSAFEGLDWAPRRAGDGDPARAIGAADRAARLAPWDDVPHYYRAQTLIRLASATERPEPLDAAEASARRAIRIEPSRSLDHQCLGTVFLARARLGDPHALERARAAFGEATRLAPFNALLWLQLADAEIALGRPADALPRIRRALDLYPDQEIAHRMWERAQAAAAAAPPG